MYKKLNQKGFHHVLMIALIVVVVAAVGFAGWYVWDKNKADDSANITSPTPTPSVTATVTPTATPISNTTAVAENELDTLRTFCQGTDPDTLVGSLQYVENTNGKFGLCGIGSRTEEAGGAMLVAAYVDGVWTRVWSGNGMMENSLCAEYKIPSTIYADCTGHYE
jgi:hypothetical protein